MELADALSAPSVRGAAAKFLQAVRRDALFSVIGYDAEVYGAGFQLFASGQDKARSLTDCISFCVMSDHRLAEALMADNHFEQAGFRAVFKDSVK